MAAGYSIAFLRSAREELEALDPAVVARIVARVEALGLNPRPRGCHKLRVGKNLWRIRVGVYRVVYRVDDENLTVEITAVRHRSEAYR